MVAFDDDSATPQTWIKTRIVRCPKCGQSPTNYREHMMVHSDFAAKPGLRDEDGWHTEDNTTHVTAMCGCGYRWRLRGVVAITQLDLPQQDQEPLTP